MASKQSVAVVELYCRWRTVPAADHEQRLRDIRLLLEDSDAVAHLAGCTRPKLAA